MNDGLLIGASRWASQCIAIGVVLPSVMPNVGTPRDRRAQHRVHRLSQAAPEADGDHQILVGQAIDLVLQVAGAADRRFGIESERHQAVGEEPRQRRREIHADHENPPRAVDLRRQLDDAIGVERRLEDAEILAVAIETVSRRGRRRCASPATPPWPPCRA